jgi:hypothetical protein
MSLVTIHNQTLQENIESSSAQLSSSTLIRPLLQSYIKLRKNISVCVTCSNTCHNIIVHILYEGNVFC